RSTLFPYTTLFRSEGLVYARRAKSASQRAKSAWAAVPAGELAAGLRGIPHEVHVTVGIVSGIGRVAVAHLQVQRRGAAAIDELMAVAAAGREAGTHAGAQHLLACVAAQHHLALEHINELVLVRVPVAHGGLLARRQPRQVDADARQPERIAEAALVARQHARAVRLGI